MVSYLETGVLHCKDNAERLADFPPQCVDLIYLDPPFFSNKKYEVVWGDEAEVRSFMDRWTGGMPKYIEWMEQRLVELHRVLKPTGSLYLHCDASASHYLKVALDKIFGARNFQGEVIWRRSAAHVSSRRWPRIHDTLLVYAADLKQVIFHPPKVAADPEWIEREYRNEDDRGRYSLDNLTGAGTTEGPSGQPWRGVDPGDIGTGRHWRYSPDKLDALDADGRIYWPKRGKYPKLKQYLHESGGKAVGDIWLDIPVIGRTAAERLGYPTQKPEALLERIIEASSSPGDIVLDPFCGCGTTIAVAERMKRKWVGLDISPTAIEIVNARILTMTSGTMVPDLRDMPKTAHDLRELQPFEFQNWIMRAVNGIGSPRRSGDMGVDGLSFMYHEPIQVKQSDKVGRPVVDSFEAALLRSGKDVGYIVAFSFAGTAYDEAVEFKQRTGKKIVLVTIAELLKGVKAVTRPRANTGETKRAGSPKELMRLLAGRKERIMPPAPESKPSPSNLVESASSG